MHNIDAAGNDSGTFRDPTPPDVQGTVVDAAWLNAVQGEVVNVIEAAGIALTKGDHTQLLAAISVLAGGGEGVLLPNPYSKDAQEPAEKDPDSGEIVLPGDADAWTWNEVVLNRSGVHHRLRIEAKSDGALTSNMEIMALYLKKGDYPVVRTRWEASTAYEVGDRIIPTAPNANGFHYECTTAGASGASEPTWGTTAGGTTGDGTAVWTCRVGGMKKLSHLATPPGTAFQGFTINSADLQIPSSEVGAGDRVYVGIGRRGASDANDDGFHHIEARFVPVEVS